jgi:hypothetical protein
MDQLAAQLWRRPTRHAQPSHGARWRETVAAAHSGALDVNVRKLEKVFRGVGWVGLELARSLEKGSATSNGRAIRFGGGAQSEKTTRCSLPCLVSSVWFPRRGGSRHGGGLSEGAGGKLDGNGGR